MVLGLYIVVSDQKEGKNPIKKAAGWDLVHIPRGCLHVPGSHLFRVFALIPGESAAGNSGF